MLNEGMEISISDKNLRSAIYEAFDGKCFYTGRDVPEIDMTVDHLMPKALGGKNIIENYVLTNRRTNLKKSANIDSDRIDKMLFIVRSAYAPKVYRLLKVKGLKQLKTRKRTLNRDIQVGRNRYITKKIEYQTNPCPYCGTKPKTHAIMGYPGSPEDGWSDYFWIHCCNDACEQNPTTAKYGICEMSPIWYWNKEIFLDRDVEESRADMPDYMKDFEKRMEHFNPPLTFDSNKGDFIRYYLDLFGMPRDAFATVVRAFFPFSKNKLDNAFRFVGYNYGTLDLGGNYKWYKAALDYLHDKDQLSIIKRYVRETRWAD
jgi:hypothetical protein